MNYSFAQTNLSQPTVSENKNKLPLFNKVRKVAISCLMVMLLVVMSNVSWGQTNNYFGTSGTLSGSVWSTNPAGPYTSALVTTGGPILNFNNAGSATGATIATTVGINFGASITWTAGGTIGAAGINLPINVSTGIDQNLVGQSFSTSATAAITKNGNGALQTAGGTYAGGFTLNAGTLVAGGVNALGNGALTINGGTISGSATRTFAGKFTGITIGGDFALGAITGLSSSVANLTFDAAMSLGNSTTRAITIGGTGTYTLGGIISGTSSNLTINSTAAGTIVLTGANTYSGLTTVSAGTLQLNRTGGTTIPINNDVTINGGTLKISSNQTLNNLTLASGATLTVDASVTLTINGTFNHNGGTVTGTGTITYDGSSVLSYGGIALQTTGAEFPTTSVNSLVINNAAGVSLNSSKTINSLTLTSGLLTIGGNVLSLNTSGTITSTGGNFVNTGGTVKFLGSGTVSGTVDFFNVTIDGAVDFGTASSVKGQFFLEGASASVANTNPPTYNSGSTLAYGTGGTFTRAAEWRPGTVSPGVPHHVQVNSGTTVNLNGAVTRALQCNGSLVVTTGLNMGAMTDALTVGGNVIVNSSTAFALSTAAGGDIFIGGSFTNNGTFTANSRTVTMTGTGSFNGSLTGSNKFYDLVFNGTSWNCPATFDVDNDLTITAGTLTGPSVSNINISRHWTNNGTFTANTSTVTFTGSGVAHSISGNITGTSKFYKLALNSPTGSLSFSGSAEISNDFIITDGTVTAPSGTLTVTGNWINNGTFLHNNGTVVFSGSGTTTISGASTNSFNNITITHQLTGPASNMNVAGNWINDHNFLGNGGTVTFNGNTSMSGFVNPEFFNVIITGTLTSNFATSNIMHLGGDWTNNGTYNAGGNSVMFNGTSPQSLGGSSATTFNSLQVTNATGVTLTQDITVNTFLIVSGAAAYLNIGTRILNMATGSFFNFTGSSTLMIVADGGGEIRKFATTAAEASRVFPVGDNTVTMEYSPVTLLFTPPIGTFPANSYVSVKLADAKHPNNGSGTDFISRYWTVSLGNNSSSDFSGFSCNVTVTYIDPADINGTEANIVMAKWDGSTWQKLPPPTLGSVNTTNNTLSAIGVTSFSDFTGLNSATPSVVITPNPATVCQNGSLTLTATATGDYPFTFSSPWVLQSPTTATQVVVTTLPFTNVPYAVTATDANGFTANDSRNVTVNALPTISGVTGTMTICSGTGTTLTAASSATSPVFKWYDQSTGGTLLFTGAAYATGNLTANTSYYAEVTDGNGCTSSPRTQVDVTVNARPTSVISGDATICNGQSTNLSITFTGTAPFTYAINGGTPVVATTNPEIVSVSPTTTTVYTVISLSDGNCASIAADRTGSATVTVNARPTSVITGDATICNGQSTNLTITFTGTAPFTYAINGGTPVVATTNPEIVSVSPTTTTVYTVTLLSDFNCASIAADRTGSATVTVNARPTSVISGDATICNGQSTNLSITFTGTAPFTYAINGGTPVVATTNPEIVSVSPTTTTVYNVTSLSDFNCASIAADRTGSATVTVNARPTSVITGDATICNGQSTNLSITFTGTAPFTYSINGGTPVVATTNPEIVSVSPSSTTVYTVTSLSDVNCASIAADRTGSATVTVNARPTSVITGDATICNGQSTNLSITFTGTAPFTYSINGGTPVVATTNPEIVSVSPSSTTVYTVTSLSDVNCASIAADRTGSATVTVNARPTSVITGDATICNGQSTNLSITFTGTAPFTYSINGGTPVVATTNPEIVSVSPSSTTVYTVTSLSDVNCASIAADRTGSATVTVNARPTSVISGDATICNGQSTNLSITFTGTAPFTYSINGGTPVVATTNPEIVSVSPTTTTVYTVTSLSDFNCASIAADRTGSATVTVNARPTSVISGDATICNGQSTNLSITFTGTAPFTYSINGGTPVVATTNPEIVSVSPTTTTVYTVTSLSDFNCASIAADRTGSATVTVNARPTSVISGDATICNGQSTNLSITFTGTAPFTYSINGGTPVVATTNPEIVSVSPTTTTVYTVTSLSDFNCATIAADRTGSATVTVNARPTSVISGDATICNGQSTNLSITFTGTAPFTYSINGGTPVVATTNPEIVSVSPATTTVYTVTSLSDFNCASIAADRTGSATVTVTPQSTWYQDTDNDGYGSGATQLACTQPSGYVATGGDCNDLNNTVYPGAPELCDGLDNDCDGSIDENFDTDGDTYTTCGDVTNIRTNGLAGGKDCNDNNAAINPGATEVCDGVDNDCDGLVDEGFPEINVQGNSVSISDGDTTPSLADHTDFGNVNVSSSFPRVFTIQNTGSATLTISSIAVTGANNSEFVVTGAPTSITAGNFATFTVTFTPTATGLRSAVIHVNNDDCNEADYDFAVQGTGVCVPPTFSACPGNQAANASANCNAVVSYTATAAGTAPVAITYTFAGATTGSGSGTGSGSTFNKGTTTVTLTATNSCGTATCSFNVVVTDITPPNITCAAAQTQTADPGLCTAAVTVTGPTIGIPPVAIGQTFQGGKVAYILQPGDPGYVPGEQHGLIAAPSDQSIGLNTIWGCQGIAIPGADGIGLGTGNQNTIDIMAACGTAGIAARICGDLVLNGYDDWYLPSLTELNMLQANRIAIGGFSTNAYWSSSEYGGNTQDAYQRHFSAGSGPYGKNNALNVRAVRSFSNIPIPGDNCGIVSLINSFNGTSNASGTYPVGTTTVTWTATDASGNTATCTQVVTVVAPEINVLGNAITIVDGDNIPSTADATDFGSVCISGSNIAKTYTIENTGTAALQLSSGAITVSGTNASMFTVSGITLPNTIAATSSVTFTVTFTPSSSGTKTATIHIASNDCNEADYDFAVTALVNALPTVSCPVNSNVCINVAAFTLTGGTPTGGTYSGTGVSGGNFDPAAAGAGTHTITYTYTDGNGCTNSCTFTITVNQLPTVGCPANSSVCIDAAAFALSGVSPAGGTYSGTGVSAGMFTPATAGAGAHTITYTYTDGNGCTNSCTFTITVNALPTVSCPSNSSICIDAAAFALSGGSPAGGTYSGTGVSAGIFTPATAGAGAHTITYTYTNGNGCTNSCNFTITVNALPTVTCPGNQAANTTSNSCNAVVNYSSSSTGSPAPNITYSFAGATLGSGAGNGSGSTFSKGTTTVTLTATNSCGTATCSFNVVVTDITPPVIYCSLAVGDAFGGGIVAYILQPGDPGYDANSVKGFIASASDQSTGAPWGCYGTEITQAFNQGLGTGNQNTNAIITTCAEPGIAARICADLVLNGFDDWYLPSKDELNKLFINRTAIGISVNSHYWSSTERDASNVVGYWGAWGQNFSGGAPSGYGRNNLLSVRAIRSFSGGPRGNITLNVDAGLCISSATIPSAFATDNCSVVVVSGPVPAGPYPVGTTTVTWTATDGSGNTATCTQVVTVIDNQPPATPTLSNVTGECSATATAPTTTDNCAGTITGTTTTVFPITTQGTTVVTWTFNDGNGNSTTANQNVIVDDVTAPVTPTLADVTVGECSGTPVAPTTTDVCAGTITGTTTTVFPITTQGTTMVAWTFNDGNGNSTTANQNVIVDDVTAPVTPTLADVTVGECSGTPVAPATTDVCAGTITGTTTTVFPITTQGTTVVTWTFNDGNGNSTTANQNVIVDDVTAPVTPTLADVTVGECSGTPVAPTTTDVCAGTITGTTTTVFPITTQGTTVVTWTFNDGNGNSTTANQNVIVDDVTAPVTPTLADVTVGECSGTPVAPATTDVCAGTITGTTTTVFPITTQGTTVVTWTFNDGNGNSTTANQNVIVDDVTSPTISCPANIVKSNDLGVCGAVVNYTVTPNDNCTGYTVQQTAGLPSGSTFPVGTTTNTFVVTDAGSNTATCSFTVTVNDTEKPVINCPSNITVPNDLNQCGAVVTYTAPVGTDNCPGATTSQVAGLPSGSFFPVGATINTFKVVDAYGNTSTCSFTVKVNDTQLPSITCPGPITVNNDADQCGAVVNYTPPVGTDNCPGANTTLVAGLPSGSLFPVGTTTNVFIVVDASGNIKTCSFTVTVNDAQNPAITCPADITVSNTTGQCGAIVNYAAPVGTDNCPGATTTQIAGLPGGAFFPVGTTTNTFRVTDASGNSFTCSFNVIVNDNENPAITCPANISVSNDKGVCGAVVTFLVPFSDNCPGATILQTLGLPSGSTFPVGTTTNTFIVTDANTNTTTCSFTVTVVDTETPSIICPANITVTAPGGQCGAAVTYTAPVGTDNCTGAITTQIAGLASGATFPVGTTVNTFRVIDGSGNSMTCSFTVTVVDAQPPTISCPASITTNNDVGQCGAVATYTTPTGSDNCIGATTSQVAGLPSGSMFPIGTTVNTFKVVDASGNTATCSFTVTVNDTEKPVINCPVNVTVPNDPNQCGTVVNYTAPAGTDNCPGASTSQVAGLPSGSLFPVGTTTNIFIVVDASGNTKTCSFTVTVNDTEKPVTPAITNATGECSVTVTPPSTTDNCAGTITGTTSDPLAYTTQGTFTITWIFNDGNGNSTTATQTVIVDDITPPATPIILNATGECSVAVTPPTTTDNCAGTILGTTSDPVVYTLQGTFTITWTFNDGNGNSTTATQTVIVDDITPPATPIIPNATGECSVAVTPPTTTDNCAGTILGTTSDPVVYTLQGTFTITWTFNDGNGNSTTATQTVIVDDITPPATPIIPNATGECSVAVTPPTTTDNCAGTILGTTSDPVVYTLQGTFTITWTFNDGNGNSTTATQTVIVDDITPPATPIIPNATGECSVTVTPPTTTDNCAGVVTGTTSDPLTYTSQGTFTITWTFNDGNGNSTTATQTVIVDDITPPVTPTIPNATGECSVTVTAPVTTDNCAGTVTGTTSDPLTYTSQGTFTITWTFYDGNGNTATATQTVVVDDVTPPVIPALPTLMGECSVTAPVPVGADNCAGSVTATSSDPLTYNADGTYTIHWTFNDGNGNTATANQTVIVDDVTPPLVPVLPTVNGQCNASVTAPTTTDNCAGTVTGTTSDPLSYSTQGTFTITWTFNDGRGNTSTATQTVVVDDVTPPAVPVLTTIFAQCNATVPTATTTDNCAGTITGTTSDPLSYTTQGVHVVTWTFNDGNGNISTAVQYVFINDVTAPVPDLASLPTQVDQCEVTPVAPTATDNCVGPVTGTTFTQFPVTAQGTTVITWLFNDGNGNISTQTQTIIVNDLTPPVAPVLPVITAECSVTVTPPTTTDNCAGTVIGFTGDPLTYSAQGTYTITWIFSDGNGNITLAKQTVVIDDVTPPVPPTLTDIHSECSATPPTPVAQDNCVGTVTGTTTTTFPITAQGTTVVTWTFNDGNGNTSTATQNVIINDATSPTITCPASITQSAGTNCSKFISVPNATINDNCGVPTSLTWVMTGATTGSSEGPGINQVVGKTFNVGVTTITYTVTDAAGNTASCSFTVTVTETVLPSITCPANVKVNTTGSNCYATGVNLGNPITGDNCGVQSVTNNAPSQYPVGVTSVTWTVTDKSGNTKTCVQTVTVTDNQDPLITCPANITQNAGSNCQTMVTTPNPTYSDNCSGIVSLTWCLTGATSGNSASTGINFVATRNFNLGVTTVTYTVKDASGRTSTCCFSVTVVDNEDPVITCPGNITQSAGTNCSKKFSVPNPTFSDNCSCVSVTWCMTGATTGSSSSYGINYVGSKTFNVGVTTITYTAEDAWGNTAHCSFTVTVTETVLPTITCPSNKTVNTNPNQCYATNVSLGSPKVGDNCGVASVTNNAPTQYPVGATPVVWTVTDNSGNIRTCTQTVTVIDNQKPTVNCPGDMTICKVATNMYTIAPLTRSDNCGIASTTYQITGVTTRSGTGTDASGLFNVGLSSIKWTVTDIHSNVSTCTTKVTISTTGSCLIVRVAPTTEVPAPKTPEVKAPNGKLEIIAKQTKLEVTAYPNPTEYYFNLRVKSQSKETIEIRMYDMTGKLVQQNRGAPEKTYRFGDQVVSGMYIIEVRQAGQTATIKVVKQ